MLSWIRGKPTETRYSRSASVQEQLFKASIEKGRYTDITLFYIDLALAQMQSMNFPSLFFFHNVCTVKYNGSSKRNTVPLYSKSVNEYNSNMAEIRKGMHDVCTVKYNGSSKRNTVPLYSKSVNEYNSNMAEIRKGMHGQWL